MNNLTIYRLEAPDSYGIYTSGMWASVLGDHTTTPSDRHPFASDDSKLVSAARRLDIDSHVDEAFGWKYTRHGFISIEQYNNWVYSKTWQDAFTGAGIILKAYEVPEDKVLAGYTQCVFDIREAVLVGEYKPNLEG